MIVLITGATHTGKTKCAHQLMEKYHIPYLSINHIKMGLIRSHYTHLKVDQDQELQEYLWPIIKEMIKTVIENKQNLIIEGDYIPFTYKEDFNESYLKEIRFYCLIMSENYIMNHKDEILLHENIIEHRLSSNIDYDSLIQDNKEHLRMCEKYNCDYIWIDKEYCVNIELNES